MTFSTILIIFDMILTRILARRPCTDAAGVFCPLASDLQVSTADTPT